MSNALDLRNAPRDERGRLVEQGRDYVTLHDQSGNVTFRSVPSFVFDLKREIYIVVMNANGAVSRQHIATALKRKKTPHLISAIEELVSEGFLVRNQGYWKNGVAMYWYEVNQ